MSLGHRGASAGVTGFRSREVTGNGLLRGHLRVDRGEGEAGFIPIALSHSAWKLPDRARYIIALGMAFEAI